MHGEGFPVKTEPFQSGGRKGIVNSETPPYSAFYHARGRATGERERERNREEKPDDFKAFWLYK